MGSDEGRVLGRILDTQGLEVLDTPECIDLLGREYVGRIALAPSGRPTVRPVNFALDGHDIVFRTAPGSLLAEARRGAEAAFEVDGFDELYHTGWSVVVEGKLEAVTSEAERRWLARFPLRPWAQAVPRPHWVRLVATTISGRRIP